MQGYHFSKPIAADEFAELLRRHGQSPAHQNTAQTTPAIKTHFPT